jgi:hypothetical protein
VLHSTASMGFNNGNGVLALWNYGGGYITSFNTDTGSIAYLQKSNQT